MPPGRGQDRGAAEGALVAEAMPRGALTPILMASSPTVQFHISSGARVRAATPSVIGVRRPDPGLSCCSSDVESAGGWPDL